ncbi:MAG: hypothetical protein Q8S36_09150 [Sulfuricurvum sp.]|nr:hypothetical protein [Sulfuricurvum sp.]
MSNLPSPKAFKDFSLSFVDGYVAATEPKEFDLQGYDTALKSAAKSKDRNLIINKLNSLIDSVIMKCDTEMSRKIFHRFIGYSKKHDSLTITLYDPDNVPKAIAIRSAADGSGNIVKWKTYGAKTFIAYRIQGSPFVFTASGMAEVLLFELLELDYFLLQSDSIVKSLGVNVQWKAIKELLDKKLVIYLLDNDDSSKAAYEAFKALYPKSIAIDFEMMWDRDLPHGYDFRDFCNQIAREFNAKEPGLQKSVYSTITMSLFLEIEKHFVVPMEKIL